MEPFPNPPIACNMNALSAEERERRATLVKQMARAKPAVDPLDDGFVFRFRNQPGIEDVLRELIRLELRCCPFLVFEITPFPPEIIELRIRGPEGSKAVIMENFRLEPRKP